MKVNLDFSGYQQQNNHELHSKSNCCSIGTPLELHNYKTSAKKIQYKGAAIDGGSSLDLDVNAWLPAASKEYDISPNLSDYVLVPIPAVITGIPNLNGDSSTTEEMIRFRPDHGMQAYKTFKGKPTHIEHQNDDIRAAKGVIFDSLLRPIQGYPVNFARLILLLGFDRTKDPETAARALQDGATFSIGKWYDSFACTHPECQHVCHKTKIQFCKHTNLKTRTYLDNRTNHLIYRQCRNLTGFECSEVRVPAYSVAEGSGSHIARLNSGFKW